MSSSDEGVMRVEANMHATAKSLRICAKDLELWLQRVLESWELACHDFKLLDKPMPDFKECTALHDTFISNQSAMASLAARIKTEILQEMRSHNPKDKSKTSRPSGGRNAGKPSSSQRGGTAGEADPEGGNKQPDRGKRGKKKKEGASAWPDMPKMEKQDYNSFRKEVSEAFSDGCIFYLASKCSKGEECGKRHDIPDGYDAIKAKFATH